MQRRPFSRLEFSRRIGFRISCYRFQANCVSQDTFSITCRLTSDKRAKPGQPMFERTEA